ncbi:hypothetical protein ACHWQZ_G001139 [Mnemiopsis leidyi]
MFLLCTSIWRSPSSDRAQGSGEETTSDDQPSGDTNEDTELSQFTPIQKSFLFLNRRKRQSLTPEERDDKAGKNQISHWQSKSGQLKNLQSLRVRKGAYPFNHSSKTSLDAGGFKQYLKSPCSESIFLKPTSWHEVHDIAQRLKNKSTLDCKIEPLKIAITSQKFTETFAKVINSSFSSGIFPSALKSAKVIPIHKGGSKLEVSNYRPISLLGSFSKIYEKLMHGRVLDFLDKNNSLFENQYGFRPGRSCEHALLNAQYSILQSLNKNQISLLLLLDYSKAFDVLDHSTLLYKLDHYGIRGIAKEWFESYLTNRNQFVSINGNCSESKQIEYGVPQGSILGPLLFVIYINDLPGICNLAKFILYADDANIIVTGSSMEEISRRVNQLISSLVEWDSKAERNTQTGTRVKPGHWQDTRKLVKLPLELIPHHIRTNIIARIHPIDIF